MATLLRSGLNVLPHQSIECSAPFFAGRPMTFGSASVPPSGGLPPDTDARPGLGPGAGLIRIRPDLLTGVALVFMATVMGPLR